VSRLDKQAQLFGFMNRRALELADRRQPQPAMFLDIGCGSGALMQDLPYKRIVGIDKDPDALALARERLPEARFIEADTDSGDFPGVLREILSGKPVIARLSLALHKLSDPVGTMRMLRETLPSGSVLLLLSPDQEMSCAYPGDTFERLCELWREAPGRADGEHGRKLSWQMREAGLQEITVAPYIFTTVGVDDRYKRGLLFSVFNEFRLGDWERAGRAGDPRAGEVLAEMGVLLDELEEQFLQPHFFFMGTVMIGIARI
jgi:SAM-dependent methyltransferase